MGPCEALWLLGAGSGGSGRRGVRILGCRAAIPGDIAGIGLSRFERGLPYGPLSGQLKLRPASSNTSIRFTPATRASGPPSQRPRRIPSNNVPLLDIPNDNRSRANDRVPADLKIRVHDRVRADCST